MRSKRAKHASRCFAGGGALLTSRVEKRALRGGKLVVACSAAGFTLVEALVALLLFAIVAAAALGLQVQALRSTRMAETRREAAAVLHAEVTLQRALGGVGGPCTGAVPTGWTCEVDRSCVPEAAAACDLRVVRVRLEPPAGRGGSQAGPALTATTATYLTGGSDPSADAGSAAQSSRRLAP